MTSPGPTIRFGVALMEVSGRSASSTSRYVTIRNRYHSTLVRLDQHVTNDRLRFASLYLMSFASSFGFITVLTLLPTYIDLFDPSGVVIGLFVTALAFAKAVGVIPSAGRAIATISARYS